MNSRYFTSESVTEGHPDKVCDQIADKILDELLKQDPQSRCACEVIAEPGAVHIMGEITTKADVDYIACAREVIREIGYTKQEYGFTDQCSITCSLHQQSPDIAVGVNCALEGRECGKMDTGAGDQGMMFGYACNETKDYMPLAIHLAHELTRRLTYLRKAGILPYLRPDGKAQVTVEYQDEKPKRVAAIVVSAQHDEGVESSRLREDILENLIRVVIPPHYLDENTRLYINPTGRFVLGGPAADTGLTGRKIIADTYGGYARHGGGAFSGKDPTKVDRSAAYMARYIAKHIVAAQLADKCEIQIGYAIGVAKPVSLSIDTFGTGKVSDRELEDWVNSHFDLRPAAIIEKLDLRKPVYLSTSVYGHFGNSQTLYPWEALDETLICSANNLYFQK
jgi:S-adenosylmethionine synthetase